MHTIKQSGLKFVLSSFLAFALSSVCITSANALDLSYKMDITEKQLQEHIDAMMPLRHTKMFMTITLFAPQVSLLKESNQISVFSNVTVSIPGAVSGSGRGTIVGTLEYNAQQGAFYFKQPELIELEIDKLQDRYLPKLHEAVQQVISKAMETYPVYTLDEKDAQQKWAKSILKSIEVIDQKLRITLSPF